MKILILIVMTVLITPVCFAEIYQWQDKNGKIHYSDVKEKTEQIKEIKLKEPKLSDENPAFKSAIGKGVKCRGSNRIISAKLVDKTEKSMYVEVEYFYDNKHTNETNITLRPVSDLYWTHESILAEPGHNTVNIKLAPPHSKASEYISIEKIEVMMRTPRYDKKRKSSFTHKITSKIFDIAHAFNASKKP